MPKLTGTDKQVEWAKRVRHDLLTSGHDWWLDAGRDEDSFAERIEAPAKSITGAGWWIDQRESAPEDLAELVDDGVKTAAADENPF